MHNKGHRLTPSREPDRVEKSRAILYQRSANSYQHSRHNRLQLGAGRVTTVAQLRDAGNYRVPTACRRTGSADRRVVLMLAACCLMCNPAEVIGPPPSDDRLIAFSSDSNSVGGLSIFTMHADGSRKTRITQSGSFDQFPIWSPGGDSIAFDSDRVDGIPRVWVMAADGSNAHPIAVGYYPRWSPSGTQLLFTAKTDNGIYAVFVANPDGSDQHRLTANPLGEVRAAWSPDGRRIVFSAYPEGTMNLYVVNADGSGQRQLTNTTGFSDEAAWSPDGKYIAFTHGPADDLGAIHIIKADGGDDRTLSLPGCAGAAWAPDSKDLAFSCANDSKPRIYRMRLDGSGRYPLTSPDFLSVGAAWKP